MRFNNPKKVMSWESETLPTFKEVLTKALTSQYEDKNLFYYNVEKISKYSKTNYAFITSPNENTSEHAAKHLGQVCGMKVIHFDKLVSGIDPYCLLPRFERMLQENEIVLNRSVRLLEFVENYISTKADELFLIEGTILSHMVQDEITMFRGKPIIAVGDDTALQESAGEGLSLIDIFKGLWRESMTKTANDSLQEVSIRKGRSIGFEIDDDGALLIKKRKTVDFMEAYSLSHKLLKSYKKSGNIEGMKYELAKLWYLLIIIETDVLYVDGIKKHTVSKSRQENAAKARAFILNDINLYLPFVMAHEKDFNFQEYFESTPFGEDTIKVDQKTMNFIKRMFALML